jgi:S1-C subfamily serine protease
MHHPQVVRVFATTQRPDHESPWQAHSPRQGSGSGVALHGRLIVTGAHVVADATFVQVQKTSDPDKAIARIVAFGHDCDLALLTVDDDAFWKDLPAARLGDLPRLQDEVSVVGFPTGGEELSITEGVVSRVEIQEYTHSRRQLLAITVDAAINAGNSGGPAFRGREVIGIAFQSLEDAENIGELVPSLFIRRLVKAAQAGGDLAIPGLGFAWQRLENPALRRSLHMDSNDRGVLVRAVDWGSSMFGVLQPGDVLCRLGGMDVANNGTVRYRGRYRTNLAVVLADVTEGETLKLRVLRNGERSDLEAVLRPFQPLVAGFRHDTMPDWFVYGGLVFQPLSLDYLDTWSKWWRNAPRRLVELFYEGVRSQETRQVVVVTQVLSDELTVGYEDMAHMVLTSLNGQPVRDLDDLVQRLDQATGTVVLETDDKSRAVFDVPDVRRAQARILGRYRLPSDRAAPRRSQ